MRWGGVGRVDGSGMAGLIDRSGMGWGLCSDSWMGRIGK